jgi:hypothetical protein
MNDIKIIRLFNPDLNNVSNQILIIDLKKKKYNDRILSIQNFMEQYPYYNNDEYKYFYPILGNYSKLDLMVHWHNIGVYNNEYCSCNYFLTINPTFNLNKFKNKYSLYNNYTLIQCIKEIIRNNLNIFEEETFVPNINLDEIFVPNINNNEILQEPNINLNEILQEPNINLNEILQEPNINSDEILQEPNINPDEIFVPNINNNEILQEPNINPDEILQEPNINNNEILQETNINPEQILETKYIDFNLEEYKKLNKNIFFENDDDYLLDYEKNKKNRIYSVFNFMELNPEFTINIYDEEENIYNKIINPPIITFIIPSIGRETLKNTIISLQKLKNPNWECIIVFDGIKQNIKINDNRISIYEIEKKGKKNYGGFVRNFALQMDIKSNWVGFVDDDDTISDKYIDYLLEETKKYKCIDVLIFRMMYKNGVVLPDKDDKNIVMNKVGISFAINKRIFKKKKYFFKNNSREDYCFLRDLQIKKYKMLISSYVAYFVNMAPCITNSYSKILIN